jgi:PilZ domain-containing protein
LESSPPSHAPDSHPDRRSFRRYALWFPVTLMATRTDAAEGGREVWAICRDASAGGLQLSSVSPLAVGTSVTARFRVSPNVATERAVEATIVRSESNDGDLMLAFPYRLGLRFGEPIPELPQELADQIGLEPSP